MMSGFLRRDDTASVPLRSDQSMMSDSLRREDTTSILMRSDQSLMFGSLRREDTTSVPMGSYHSMQATLRSDDTMLSLNVDQTMEMSLRRDETMYMPSLDDVDALGQYLHRDQTMNDCGTVHDQRMETLRSEDSMQCSTTVVDDYVQWRKRNDSNKSVRKPMLPTDDSVDGTINPTIEMDDTEHFRQWRQKRLASGLSVFAPQLVSDKSSLVDPSLMETTREDDFMAWRNKRQATQTSDMPYTLTSGLTLASNSCSLDENEVVVIAPSHENETLFSQQDCELQLSDTPDFYDDFNGKMNSLELQMNESDSLQYSSLYSSNLSEIPLSVLKASVHGSCPETTEPSESRHMKNATDNSGENFFISQHLRSKRTDASPNARSYVASFVQPKKNSSEGKFPFAAALLQDSGNGLAKEKPIVTKPFCCGVCDKAFTCCSHLRHHIHIHTRIRIHKCTICDSSFVKFSELEEHLRIHPDENRNHPCRICDKKFGDKRHLTSHLLTHGKSKHHECDLCGLGFLKESDLQSHLNQHEIQNMFACSFCGLTFARTGDWRRHMRRSHPEEQPIKCRQSSVTAAVDGNKHRASHSK